jgi:ATP-dependent protease ClpP protease subunit
MDKLLADLKPEDVNKAIKKYLQIDNMFVTIITDKSEAASLKENLLNNNDSPMSYSDALKSGLPKKVIAEDEEVSKFKLNIRSVDIIKSEETFK